VQYMQARDEGPICFAAGNGSRDTGQFERVLAVVFHP
jgi:hypothetical protein